MKTVVDVLGPRLGGVRCPITNSALLECCRPLLAAAGADGMAPVASSLSWLGASPTPADVHVLAFPHGANGCTRLSQSMLQTAAAAI